MFAGQKGVPLELKRFHYGSGLAGRVYSRTVDADEALLVALETGL